MYCDKLTFVIFTFNEAARIRRAVSNFTPFGKVLVVDNHSSDATRQIAEQAGAAVALHKNPGWVEDEGTVRVVKDAVTTPWIYWGYADEMVDGETLLRVVEVIEAGRHDIINLCRKNYYYGRFCHEAYMNRLNRVFRKDAIDFTGNAIHRFGTATVAADRIALLDGRQFFVHHFISNNAKTYLRTIDNYTDIEATRTAPTSFARVALRCSKSFLANVVLRGGYRAGWAGVFLGVQTAYYELLLRMKCHEREQSLDALAIERRNDAHRDHILASLRGRHD